MKKNTEKTINIWDRLRQSDGQSAVPADQPWPDIWQGAEAFGQDFEPDVEAGLKRLKAQIHPNSVATTSPIRRLTPLARWTRTLAAAVVAGLLGWGLYLLVQPAPPVATWAEITTQAGEQKAVVLPDGSKIALNEASSLTYRTDLNEATERQVQLIGEAYFEVERRATQPFKITTRQAEVEVLGTSFNVRARPNETTTEVEVTQGKVAVYHLKRDEKLVLAEKEAVIVANDQPLVQETSPHLNRQAWRTGRITFRETPLEDALPLLEHYYNVKINWQKSAAPSCSITGNWQNDSLAEVLQAIAAYTGITVKKMTADTYQLSGICK
jgi:transmembrane sensor